MRGLAPRRRGQHRDQRRLGHLAARRGHAGVADERALADLHPLDPQPAAAELVAADQGVVGQERLVVDLGERRDHQHRRGLDVLADPGAEQPQPGRGEAARRRAGTARCARRRGPAPSSRPPARRRCAPRARRAGPPRPATRTTAQISSGQHHHPDQRRDRQPEQQAEQVGVRRGVVGAAAPAGRAPGQHRDDRQAGEQHRHGAVRRRSRRGWSAGRSDHGPRARFWIRSAGEPDQYSPSGTTPNTAEPGRHLGVLADVGAGAEHAARADPGPGADPDRSEVDHVAVDPEAR